MEKEKNAIQLFNEAKQVATLDENFESEFVVGSNCTEENIYNVIYGETIQLSEKIGEEIVIDGISITTAKVPIRETYPDGDIVGYEIKPCIGLFTETGECISTISNGIFRNIRGILKIYDLTNVKLRMKVNTMKTKKGIAHTLKLIEVIKRYE